MSWIKTLSKAKKFISSEVDTLLTKAEENTPNLDDYRKKEFMDIEKNPRHLKQGDHIVAVKYHRDDLDIHDLFGKESTEGTVFSVDRRNELVLLVEDGNFFYFSEARFFIKSDIEEFLKKEETPSKSKKKQKGKVRREDMKENVIYDGEIVD